MAEKNLQTLVLRASLEAGTREGKGFVASDSNPANLLSLPAHPQTAPYAAHDLTHRDVSMRDVVRAGRPVGVAGALCAAVWPREATFEAKAWRQRRLAELAVPSIRRLSPRS